MKPNDSFVIKLHGIAKKYEIRHEKPTLVGKLMNGNHETFWALHAINLTVRAGERIGIVGPNGSGKTTLLKTITRIVNPTRGTVETRGKIVSLIDLTAGFHPELTGEQNIFLNGLIIGMNKQEIAEKLRAIIRFADLGRFIDVPLYTFSEGMKLRLGFAIAVYANPDILLLDEGIGFADEKFYKKSVAKIDEYMHEQKTVIMASHWIEFIRQNCTRILILKKGTVKADGGLNLLNDYKLGKI